MSVNINYDIKKKQFVEDEMWLCESATTKISRIFTWTMAQNRVPQPTLRYRIKVADGISVVVHVFLKNNKRGGSNKHGGKFYGFYHIFQIGIF